jgi:hypothetical protein
MSGMMAARFLLHLQKWEAKHSLFATTNNENFGETSVMEFARPNQTASQSCIDDSVRHV